VIGVVFVVSALPLLLAYAFVRKANTPVSAEDVRALHLLSGVSVTPSTDRLFAAYLSRARRYRTGWSVVGWLSGLVLGFAFGHAVGIGGGGNPAYGDLLLVGFGGYLAGAIVAELHHLRRPRSQVRMASIVPRHLDQYVTARAQWRLRALAIAAAVAVVTELAFVRAHIGVAGFGIAALLVWGIVERTQQAVVHRPRPAMPEDLARGDDAVRSVSVQSLSLGGAGLVSFLLVWAARTAGDSWWAPVSLVCAFGLFFLGIALALRARRLVWPKRRSEVEGVRT
jgi:hypothetical protein